MAAIIAGVSILAIAFMVVFFVKICAEGRSVKVCEVLQLDTKPYAPRALASQRAGNVIVMSRTLDDGRKIRRSRKPA